MNLKTLTLHIVRIRNKKSSSRWLYQLIIIALLSPLQSPQCQDGGKEPDFNLTGINYEIIGSGTPILMIHGMGVDHRAMKNAFEPIFDELADTWKRVYLDLPGMGRTNAFASIHNSDDMVDFLVQFIDHVIPDEEFVIAGYSYGGYLARGLLCKKREKIKGAIFVCPLVIAEDKKRNIPKNLFYIKDPALQGSIDSSTRALVDYFLVNQNAETIKKFEADIVSGHSIGNRQFIDKIRNDHKKYSFSKKLIAEFSRFEGKTIFITAKQDRVVGYSDAQEILHFFPENTFVVIDSAGHAVQIDKQVVFESQIKKYLLNLGSK